MNLPNKPRVLASTYNPVSNTKMISFLVDFPTVLLAELRTHRILTQGSLYEHSELVDFSCSANSARAIPTNKYLDKVLENPFVPIWTKQQKGMSGELCDEDTIKRCTQQWLQTLKGVKVGRGSNRTQIEKGVINRYDSLIDLGIHKQNANRLLSPFAYTTCIITGTEWENFFKLRCPKYELWIDKSVHNSKKSYLKKFEELRDEYEHPDYDYYIDSPDLEFNWDRINKSTAQPEFQIIAEMLYDLYQEADWKESKYHIPFEEDIEKYDIYDWRLKATKQKWDKIPDFENVGDEVAIKMFISASMCAKLSYDTQDNPDTLEKHLERAEMLIKEKHFEPFSHQSIVMDRRDYMCFSNTYLSKEEGELRKFTNYGKCWNLVGFISQRYILENYV